MRNRLFLRKFPSAEIQALPTSIAPICYYRGDQLICSDCFRLIGYDGGGGAINACEEFALYAGKNSFFYFLFFFLRIFFYTKKMTLSF